MHIFPAIDLMDGKVVRLFQGDYQKQTEYGKDPVSFAKAFEEQGAKYLHLVDLDGAKSGSVQNFDAIKKITKETHLFVEFGGGVRSEDTVKQCFDAGIGRVILGTSALRQKEFTAKMVDKYKEKIAVGVDARNGKVAVAGWLDTSDVDAVEFCKELRRIGVFNVIFTDISKDGAGEGPNFGIYKTLSQIDGLAVTASGGVSSIGDVVRLNELKLYAAIVGKALYTGKINLKDALSAAR